MELIDLGHDVFLKKLEYYDHVIDGGLRFIGGRFLTIRKWVPNFRASEASFDLLVVWIWLLEFHLEYYETNILCKIDTKLEGCLWIDNATMKNERGKFARLYIQVDLRKPLAKYVVVDGRQDIIYEGIKLLYFHYGVIRPKSEG